MLTTVKREKRWNEVQERMIFSYFLYFIQLILMLFCPKKWTLLNHELTWIFKCQLYCCILMIFTYYTYLSFYYAILKFYDPKMNGSHQITQFDLILKQNSINKTIFLKQTIKTQDSLQYHPKTIHSTTIHSSSSVEIGVYDSQSFVRREWIPASVLVQDLTFSASVGQNIVKCVVLDH